MLIWHWYITCKREDHICVSDYCTFCKCTISHRTRKWNKSNTILLDNMDLWWQKLLFNSPTKINKISWIPLMAMHILHTCQPPEFQNLETPRNPRVVRIRFTTMSEYSPRITPKAFRMFLMCFTTMSECSPRIPRRLSEFSRHLSVEQYQRFWSLVCMFFYH